MNPYLKLHRTVELLHNGDFNSAWVVGKPGTGKSFQVDAKLDELKANYTVFKGDITEAKFFQFLQDNNGKIIVIRDSGKFLRQISFIDILKQATELKEPRTISRLNYAKHENVEPTFDFKGRLLIELNAIGKKYKEDLEALFSRGLLHELVLSREEIEKIMWSICKTKEEALVTKYLLTKAPQIGKSALNLRVQYMCFRLFTAAKRDKLPWQKEVDIFLETQMSESRKLLYRFCGFKQVRRMEYVKYLTISQGWSISTAQRRIKDWLLLEELFTDGKGKREMLCLNPIGGAHGKR